MIKNWFQFISESTQLELFKDEGIFPFSSEDISDYLCELEDAKYLIDIDFGWAKLDEWGRFNFTEKIEQSLIVNPCIEISINSQKITKDEDVTPGVRSFINRMRTKAKSVVVVDVEVDLEVDIKNLKLNGDIFLSDSHLEEGIKILVIFNKRKLTYREILEYYGIFGDKIYTENGEIDSLSFDKNGIPIIEVEVNDLINWLVSKSDQYVKYILDPFKLEEHYLGSSDFMPDHQSFLEYYLDVENIELLLKVCIKLDGWEEIKNSLGEQEITEDEFIKNPIKKIGSKKLGKIISDLPESSGIYDELRRMYTHIEEETKANEDLEIIISEFDKLVESQFETKIVEKNTHPIKVSKNNKDGKRYEYYDEFQTYKLLFNFNWLNGYDVDIIKGMGNVRNLLLELTGDIYTERLDPCFNDYADVDLEVFNDSAKSMLMNYLKSTE